MSREYLDIGSAGPADILRRREEIPFDISQPRRNFSEFVARVLRHEKLEVNGLPVKTVASNIRSMDVPWHEFSFEASGCGFEGDIVLGQVAEAGGSTARMENIFGRDENLFEGDRVLAVLGNRRSGTSEYGGIPPEGWDIAKKPIVDLLCHGGILGELEDIPRHMTRRPTRIKIEGLARRGGRNVNTKDFFPEWESVLLPSAPLVVVCGTSAESGKTTTAAALIQALKSFGYRVAATKLTGTGRYRDLLALRDAGADAFFDFPDVGLPSTYTSRERFLPAIRTLLNKLNREHPDIIVAELGGDIIEANIPEFFDDQDFHQCVQNIVLVANDVVGMKGAVDILQQWTPEIPFHLALPKERNRRGTMARMEAYLKRPAFDALNPAEVRAMVHSWRGVSLPQNPHAELYREPRDLETRVRTFSRFLELLEPNPSAIDALVGPLQGKKILDLGCGTGTPLLPVGPTFQDEHLDMVGMDASQGALKSLQEKYPQARCTLGDAEHMPFESESFDLVVARHMLYHVGDIHAALQEIRRVLKPDGCCLITTNGERNRPELWRIHERAVAETAGAVFVPSGARRFSAENGAAQMALHFEHIQTVPWRGQMRFTDASDIMAYYTSAPYFQHASFDAHVRGGISSKVQWEIQTIIDREGSFRLSHGGALFIVHKGKMPESIMFHRGDPETTVQEVKKVLSSRPWAVVNDFPCHPDTLMAFAKLLGSPMLKHSYDGEIVDTMSSIGDIRFRPDMAAEKRMPTQGCEAIALHTAHAYSQTRPRYFAMLMADSGWREEAGQSGESLLLHWEDSLREYRKHFPDTAEGDIALLMNTPVPYAPWYVHETPTNEPLFRSGEDGNMQVRYWANIVSTVAGLMQSGGMPHDEIFIEALRRFDGFVQGCAAVKEFRMEKGQLLVVDNRKAAHGRRSFVGIREQDGEHEVNSRQLFSVHIE